MDKERIVEKIVQMNAYVEEIEELKPTTLEEYKRSIKDKRACERAMQIALETMVDIAYMLVRELNLGIPFDEDALFDKLNKKGVLSDEVAKTCKEMKGFRNILVHKYGEVEDEKAFENLQKLNDFGRFKEEILTFVKAASEKDEEKDQKEIPS